MAKRMGISTTGPMFGGSVVCLDCEPVVAERFKAKATQEPAAPKNLPEAFKEARLENYRPQQGNREAVRSARAFMAGHHDLFLLGPVGTGKTRLACSLLNELAERHKKYGLFVRVPELLDALRFAGGDGEHGKAQALVDSCHGTPLLVLDDVGADKGSDYGRRTLQTILDHRLDRGRRTVWTSNLTLDELSALYGDDRLTSRIAGASDVCYVGGTDQRLAQRRDWRRQDQLEGANRE